MATLTIVNNFELSTQGNTFTGKQGLAASEFSEGYDVTVSGYVLPFTNALATASVRTLFDDDNQFPADWVFFHFWADGICYLQLIGATTSATFKIPAYQPFTLSGYDSVLGAASTTAITGGSEPTLEDIDSIVLGNYSGASITYAGAVIV